MAKIIPISEHFQHFLAEMKESFWGDLYGQTKLAWQRFFELQSERQRDRYSGWGRYERRRGLRGRRPAGRKRVQMLVAYGVRRDGRRHLLAFLRSQGESQADWEGLLQDLYRRGLEGKHLALIVTDGCAGLAAAIPTVYPRARHQRCWVHKMRNILEKVRKSDHAEVKTGAQAIYLAEGQGKAETAFRSFGARWRRQYGAVVRRLEQDLPELLSFFAFPRHLWRKLRTTNVIERCFVEVRRRTRPMVCSVNVESVDRIIYSIFQRFNLEWKTRTLNLFTQAA